MRHSTTFLMSLIVASILVLMFLNLVLGSVSIPLKSVWNIICGLGDEPVTWQNIVWKSRLPQALTALVAGAGLAIILFTSLVKRYTEYKQCMDHGTAKEREAVQGLSLIHI